MSLLTQASLIVTPNAYKEGKLYSVIPSDGSGDLSVTRATTATRVNSQGLVELVPYNLAAQSNGFSDSVWVKSNTTVTSGQADPFGGNTAFRALNTAAGGFLLQSGITITGASMTASVWVKSNTGSTQTMFFLANSGAEQTSVSVTTSWQRVTFSFTSSSNTNIIFANNASTALDILIYGFQLVEGSVAKDYQKTETRLNIPRLDYSNGTCPSILVEPQRTNYLTYSSSFDNAAWDKSGATVTANDTTAPDGTMTADKVVFSGANKTIRQALNMNGAIVTASVYIKGTAGQTIGIDDIFATQQIVTLTGEWQRLQFTAASPNGYGLGISTFGGVTATTIWVWGAQLELGSYQTSYIPTTSASVTRNADVISKTGATDLIGQTEGTLYVDFVCNGFADYGTPLCINAGSTASSVWITTFGNGDIRGEVYTLGNVQATFTMPGGVVGQRYKVAFVYKVNDFAMYVNGNLIGTDINGSAPVGLNRVDFDYTNSSLFVKSALEINAAALWKTRLTNAQLATLTTI